MSLSGVKAAIPWQVKIGAKIVLSRLPVPYGFWSRLNLFKHGEMEDLAYAQGVFKRHHDAWLSAGGRGGFTFLELGPGDSLLSAMVAKSLGATRTWLVDTGPWATDDVEVYRRAARALWPTDLEGRPAYERWTSVADMLRDCNAEYLTQGLASIASLAPHSVDLIWSQAVLEHVKRSEFAATMSAMKRVLRPNGVSSHVVDFKDHLGGRLNNLRFSEATWEGRLFSTSGFYTNRLRANEVVRLAREAGLAAEVAFEKRWQELPTPRERLDAAFQAMADEDLLVSDMHVVLKHSGN